ncbi:MAG TPA: hypothetical protein VGO43_12100 [Pyrinomonadaceae bacterium]|nr:hypothetical protein [Pyrinomonadaceae bacterium]
MQTQRLCPLLAILLIPGWVFAQANTDAAKEKQARLISLADDVIAEIPNLRLAENRAYAYAQAGRVVFDRDQKRGHSLYQSAGTELLAASDASDARPATSPYRDRSGSNNLRQQILNTIGEKDASFALDLLVRTRPPEVVKAMTTSKERSAKISDYNQNSTYLIQNETYLEQNLYRLAAEQDPDRAVVILRTALSKSLSTETYNQLERLAEKDLSAAAEMSSQVVKKVINESFVRDGQPVYANVQLTTQILSTTINNDPGSKLKFEANDVQALLAKAISSYLSDPAARGYFASSLPMYVEKLAPAFIQQVKLVSADQPGANAPPVEAAYQKLIQSDTPPDQMLASANKFPMNYRRQIYETAANKLLNQGNADAARAVLAENFDGEAGDQLLANFDQQYADRLMTQAKFDQAETVINGLPEYARSGMLIQLASRAFGKDNNENRTYAINLLSRARALIGDRPENNYQMSSIMSLISAMAQIDPDRAIGMYEALIPQINQLAEASAIVVGFQNESGVRDGEFVMTQGGPLAMFGAHAAMFGQFANADIGRTIHLIDSFSRPEVRVSLKLQTLANGQTYVSIPLSRPVRGRGGVITF